MKNFFGLTAVEVELMELFWNTSEPLSFKEVMDYVTTVLNKAWKKQTLNTYLSNMQKAGFAKINKPVGSDKKSFFAANWRNYVY